jgi:hypothetical protein
MPYYTVDVTGQKFGRLTAVSRVGSRNRDSIWLCRCDCGRSHRAILYNLRNGHTRSCGCLKADAMRRRATHGMRDTREFNIWNSMRQRCSNPRQPSYQDYGARGIRVCELWQNSFAVFFADMGPCPSGHSIERVNNDAGYSPENCKWATPLEQRHNRRPVRSKRPRKIFAEGMTGWEFPSAH